MEGVPLGISPPWVCGSLRGEWCACELDRHGMKKALLLGPHKALVKKGGQREDAFSPRTEAWRARAASSGLDATVPLFARRLEHGYGDQWESCLDAWGKRMGWPGLEFCSGEGGVGVRIERGRNGAFRTRERQRRQDGIQVRQAKDVQG